MHTSSWKHFQGVKRVQAELKHFTSDLAAGKHPNVSDLSVGDDVLTWRFKLSAFDDEIEGGEQLNRDLQRLRTQ
jgi:hypothetical protein